MSNNFENENKEEEKKIVSCVVELKRIFFPKGKRKTESGEFAIASFDIISKEEDYPNLKSEIKIKGNFCMLEYFVQYNVKCILKESSDMWGDTYELLYSNRLIDMSDKSKQRTFLKCVLPEKTIDNLFDKYDDVVSLLANKDIEALAEVKGIGLKRAVKLCDIYEDSKDYGEVYAELGHLGIGVNLIKKLVDFYKSPDTVVDIIKSNPYSLVNVDGIGFAKADAIADKIGIKGANPNRIKGGILYLLNENGKAGISFVHYQNLMQSLFNMIGYIENDVISKVCRELVMSRDVVINGEYVGIKKYYDIEVGLYREFMRILKAEPHKDFDYFLKDWDGRVKDCENEQGFAFTDEQKEAIEMAKCNNILVITGGAGVGKSSVAKGFLSGFGDLASKTCCALSGKASVRIKEATGFESSTIHKALGVGIDGFVHDENVPMESLIYLVDEATMVNGELFLAFLKAIPSGAKLFVMGDIQQLTPIGSCQVFADLLNSNVIPSIRLTKPHRQAMEGGIIPTSIKIAKQEQIFDSTFTGQAIIGESVKDMMLDIYNEDPDSSLRVAKHFMDIYRNPLKGNKDIMSTQIVSLCKKGDLGVYNLNTMIQNLVNPIRANENNIVKRLDKENTYVIQKFDKVINTENKSDLFLENQDGCNEEDVKDKKVSISNGDIGIVKEIGDKGECVVYFEGIGNVIMSSKDAKSLDLAYSITCHKCLPSSTYVYTNKGIKQLKDLDNGAKIGEFKEYNGEYMVFNGKYLEKPSHFYNNGKDECLTFKTKSNYSITTTKDHRLDVMDEKGNVVCKNSKDIKIGDLLLIRNNQNVFYNENILNIQEPKVDDNTEIFYAPKELNEDFSELLGLIIANGTMLDNRMKVITHKESSIIRFCNLVNKIFGYEANYKPYKDTNKFSCEINSIYIRDILNQIDGLDENNKHIPNIILQSNKDNQCAFLKGLFGRNKEDDELDNIEFTTSYKVIADVVRLMLLNIGIVTTLKITNDEYTIYSNINDGNTKYIPSISKYYYFDEVVEITTSIEDTYCLTMPETHRFVQNGIQGWNCQGSGFPYVIVPVDFSAFKLLNCEMLYTAITRAKKFCVLVGLKKAIIMAINNRETNKKSTYLGRFLNKELPVPEINK